MRRIHRTAEPQRTLALVSSRAAPLCLEDAQPGVSEPNDFMARYLALELGLKSGRSEMRNISLLLHTPEGQERAIQGTLESVAEDS